VIGRGLFAIVLVLGVFIALQGIMEEDIHRPVDLRMVDLLRLIGLGFLTMGRVLATVLISSLVWVPIGVAIGLRPRLAKWVEPAVQVAASLPVNTTFPWVIVLLSTYHIPMNWGSILLLSMGTQWYVLFNIIAGAGSISSDWKEVAQMCRLRGWQLWKTVFLPAVFPFWVTGACSAAGGAWNASVVSELASWGDITLKAEGLGAVIAEVTREGRRALIFVSIGTMAMMVVGLNRLIWKPLYALAEKRFRAV
jgi:NitT/TauT family transport system permease protein